MRRVPKMPEEYQGKINKPCGYTKTEAPRQWTNAEIEWCRGLKKQGYSEAEIADSIDRTKVAVSLKFKKLSKKAGRYNTTHSDDKYTTNRMFCDRLQPGTILDVFAGPAGGWYRQNGHTVVTNDKNPANQADYQMDALKFMCLTYLEGKTYDLVDLDPFGSAYECFGSAYECFDLAIKTAKKGLVITFGEIGHRKFKRTDYVERFYGINNAEDISVGPMIEEVQRIGRQNKKQLKAVYVKEWGSVSRVYFEIEDFKITSQWADPENKL